jgi:hypothetical protein
MFAAGVFESDHTARRHSISLRIVLISFASFKKGQEQRSNIRWPLTFLPEAGSCRDFFIFSQGHSVAFTMLYCNSNIFLQGARFSRRGLGGGQPSQQTFSVSLKILKLTHDPSHDFCFV